MEIQKPSWDGDSVLLRQHGQCRNDSILNLSMMSRQNTNGCVELPFERSESSENFSKMIGNAAVQPYASYTKNGKPGIIGGNGGTYGKPNNSLLSSGSDFPFRSFNSSDGGTIGSSSESRKFEKETNNLGDRHGGVSPVFEKKFCGPPYNHSLFSSWDQFQPKQGHGKSPDIGTMSPGSGVGSGSTRHSLDELVSKILDEDPLQGRRATDASSMNGNNSTKAGFGLQMGSEMNSSSFNNNNIWMGSSGRQTLPDHFSSAFDSLGSFSEHNESNMQRQSKCFLGDQNIYNYPQHQQQISSNLVDSGQPTFKSLGGQPPFKSLESNLFDQFQQLSDQQRILANMPKKEFEGYARPGYFDMYGNGPNGNGCEPQQQDAHFTSNSESTQGYCPSDCIGCPSLPRNGSLQNMVISKANQDGEMESQNLLNKPVQTMNGFYNGNKIFNRQDFCMNSQGSQDEADLLQQQQQHSGMGVQYDQGFRLTNASPINSQNIYLLPPSAKLPPGWPGKMTATSGIFVPSPQSMTGFQSMDRKEQTIPGPRIGPSVDQIQKMTYLRSLAKKSSNCLPSGFPLHVEGDMSQQGQLLDQVQHRSCLDGVHFPESFPESMLGYPQLSQISSQHFLPPSYIDERGQGQARRDMGNIGRVTPIILRPGEVSYSMPPPGLPIFGVSQGALDGRFYRRFSASNELQLCLEMCFDQLNCLEKEERQVETDLARLNVGFVSSSTSPSTLPRLPHNPSLVNRLVVESLREHTKVTAILGRMKKVSSQSLHANVYSAMETWMEGIRKVQARRKEEIVSTANRNNSGGTRVQEEKDILALVAAIEELLGQTRRVRTALWCALQMSLFGSSAPFDSECLAGLTDQDPLAMLRSTTLPNKWQSVETCGHPQTLAGH